VLDHAWISVLEDCRPRDRNDRRRSDNGDVGDRPVVAGSRSTTTTTTSDKASNGTTTSTIPLREPAHVKVLTANGTNTKGLASSYKEFLARAGYNTFAATDTSKKPNATSAVYFTAGFQREARVIASLLRVSAARVLPLPTPAPVANTQGTDVLVVVGQDLVANAPTTSRPARSTTTTRRASATTTTKP
jgi:hypothetical protein